MWTRHRSKLPNCFVFKGNCFLFLLNGYLNFTLYSSQRLRCFYFLQSSNHLNLWDLSLTYLDSTCNFVKIFSIASSQAVYKSSSSSGFVKGLFFLDALWIVSIYHFGLQVEFLPCMYNVYREFALPLWLHIPIKLALSFKAIRCFLLNS